MQITSAAVQAQAQAQAHPQVPPYNLNLNNALSPFPPTASFPTIPPGMALVPIEMLRLNRSGLEAELEREKGGGVVYISSVDAGNGDEGMGKLGYPVEVLPGTGR